MPGNVTIEYDPQNDLVQVRFTRCILVNRADVKEWRADLEEKLGGFGRKMDVVIDLDGLEVTFTAGRLFGQARWEVLERYALRASCYGGDELTRMFLSTSGVLHGYPVMESDTREQAVAALKAAREAARKRTVIPITQSPRLTGSRAAGI